MSLSAMGLSGKTKGSCVGQVTIWQVTVLKIKLPHRMTDGKPIPFDIIYIVWKKKSITFIQRRFVKGLFE
jgi:hypothetical protein